VRGAFEKLEKAVEEVGKSHVGGKIKNGEKGGCAKLVGAVLLKNLVPGEPDHSVQKGRTSRR